MLTCYAIANCDTVKKARKWLEEHGIQYQFHDYKKAGVPEEKLRVWVQAEGWEAICNQRGMTWRRLSDSEKAAIQSAEEAVTLMLKTPSVIKRPIIEGARKLIVGFDADLYLKQLAR